MQFVNLCKVYTFIQNKDSLFNHNNSGDDMFNGTNYYYKGYDVTSNNRLEKLFMEYNNPYGYNLDSNERRVKNSEYDVTHTNQNSVKNKEYLGKR